MADKTPVTSRNAMFSFYDIESLEDVFSLATYTPRTNTVELFFLLEPGTPADVELSTLEPHEVVKRITQGVCDANPAFKDHPGINRTVVVHNLGYQSGAEALAARMGLFEGESVNDPDDTDVHQGRFRPVCDTSPHYDPINTHPYWAGYNSYQYDTTILSVYLHEAFRHVHRGTTFTPVSARVMREHNNEMFSDAHRQFMPSYLTEGKASIVDGSSQGWNAPAATIRKAMLDSGRHIDVARLNEGQRSVGLKRLLGGMGRQILESDRLGGHNARLESLQDLVDLLAYNVSDVVGLAQLFEHPAYASTFDLKKGLLDQYPETIYNQVPGTHKPRVSPTAVRTGRLTPDATSAKFVGRILAPYKALEDIPAVSFMYPSQKVADERGIERRNVLDDAIAFFQASIDKNTPAGAKAHEQFMTAMSYYKSIEGTNFNDELGDVEYTLAKVPRTPNNLPYFHADGSPSSCFVTFSTGGIHGAEYNVAAYEAASAEVDAFNLRMDEVRELYPDPVDFWEAHPGKNHFVSVDGTEMTRAQILTSGTSLKRLKAMAEKRREIQTRIDDESLTQDEADALWDEFDSEFDGIGYRPNRPRPELFEKASNGATKLRPQFNYTSAGLVTHEDFTSYYPNMLRNMSAFFNEALGEDRYANIFEDKETLGRQMKAAGISPEEKTRLGVLRDGTKLILNSASGVGDTTHKNPIRMNNQIISMRIIGQLFSWRVGQAQTLAGARIISTNTDGLYSVLDPETNNRILAEQAALINVEIEPEPLWLISKDSNNRLELEVPTDSTPLHESRVISASGGTLSCHAGPQPTKSLAHPAVIDWALMRYLREIAANRMFNGSPLALDSPLNRDAAMWLMTQARDMDDAVLAARLFQNVLAASAGKITFPFATKPDGTVHALQHFNRVFVMKPGTAETVSIQAAGAWVVNESSRNKRKKDGDAAVVNDPVATQILASHGFTRDGRGGTQVLPPDQDVAVRRVPRLNPEWSMRVDNRDLIELGGDVLRNEILNHLDLNAYVDMLASTFEENWMNPAIIDVGDQAPLAAHVAA